MPLTVGVAHEVADAVRIYMSFTNLDGDAADPTDVIVQVKVPEQPPVVDTYVYGASPVTIEHDGVGLYHLDVLTTIAGEWFYRAVGTGSVEEALEGSFVIRRSAI